MATRKEIHFDFDTKKLQAFYPQAEKGTWTNAYDDFRRHLEGNGFIHTQGSGYETVKGITFPEVARIVGDFAAENPWFLLCVKSATVTEIKKQHDLIEMIVEQQKEQFFDKELRLDSVFQMANHAISVNQEQVKISGIRQTNQEHIR